MKARTLFATIALTLAFGSATAATIDRLSWSSTINGLDAYLTGTTAQTWGGFDDIVVYSFEFPDGLAVPEISLFIDANDNVTRVPHPSYTVDWTFGHKGGHQSGGIAFSSSSVNFDRNGHQSRLTPGMSIRTNSSPAGLAFGGDMVTLTNFFFGGGKGLNPSPDSSCASFSCMEPYTTQGRLSLRIHITGVPEPLALALGLPGLAVVVAALRRRKPSGTRG